MLLSGHCPPSPSPVSFDSVDESYLFVSLMSKVSQSTYSSVSGFSLSTLCLGDSLILVHLWTIHFHCYVVFCYMNIPEVFLSSIFGGHLGNL